MPTVNVPSSGGRGESFANYAPEVELWNRVTNLDPIKRASAVVLHISPVAREVCVAADNDQLLDQSGAAKILQVSRDYFASEAAGPIYQEVVRFLQFKRTAHMMDEYLAPLDLLRRPAESRVQTGGVSPETFAPSSCLQNACLSRAA